MTRPALILALALLAGPAPALSPVEAFPSDRGVPYVEVESVEGTALRSTAPVTYRVGAAAERREGIETLHLRGDCTARSSLLGHGAWSRDAATGEVTLAFRGAFVTFARGPASLGARCPAR